MNVESDLQLSIPIPEKCVMSGAGKILGLVSVAHHNGCFCLGKRTEGVFCLGQANAVIAGMIAVGRIGHVVDPILFQHIRAFVPCLVT